MNKVKMTDITLTADADFDRKLFWKHGSSVRYLVARVEAHCNNKDRPSKRAPLNIALVIDASGSMCGGKLESAKEAALGLVEHLTQQDRLTVVSFASDIQVHLDAVLVNEDNATRIHAEISRLHTRGCTNLSGGWFSGVDCAARVAEVDDGMTPRVIILSDGFANEGITHPGELHEHAVELRQRGVLTSTLGIGDGYDEQLLRAIAEGGGGRLHDAEYNSELSSVLLGELEDICNTVVEDAEVILVVPRDVRVQVLGRGFSQKRSGSILVPLGSIQDSIKRVVVFKVVCPSRRPKEVLEFKLSSNARTVDGRYLLDADPITVRLKAEKGLINNDQLRNKELSETVAKMWNVHIVTETARMNRDGDYEKVQQYVQRELQFFRRYVEGLSIGKKLVDELELLARYAGREISSRMRKEMVYQSINCRDFRKDHRSYEKAVWSKRLAHGE